MPGDTRPCYAGPKFHDQKLGLMLAKVAGTRSTAIMNVFLIAFDTKVCLTMYLVL
jgi:hypothetical protein